MSSLASIVIHASQFPESVQRDLLDSLRTRQINHKFHYDSIKQTQKWLALHQAYSPSRNDADCAAIYDRSFEAVAARITARRVHLVGLGCGGGQKDARLLRLLQDSGKQVSYTPLDVSTAMVLTARQAALAVVGEQNCFPLVCDLARADDLALVLNTDCVPGAERLITFFGMMPNFEPQVILPRLKDLTRGGDHLLLSANLAPGRDYSEGVRQVLPLYDNHLTRDWLSTFLLDLGVEKDHGEIRFVIEEAQAPLQLKRVAAYFEFARSCLLTVGEQEFRFQAGEAIRLFFSYRHTPALIRELLRQFNLSAREEWITKSEQEGVFFVARD